MDDQGAGKAYANDWLVVGGKHKVSSNNGHKPSRRFHDLP